MLESAGRLFKRSVKMYVYAVLDPATGRSHSAEDAPLAPPWPHLRDLLLASGRIEPSRQYEEAYLSIRTPDVRRRIETGDRAWEC